MNLRGIDLNLALVFEAVMLERSATRAGRRLGLSQSAVSNALARLRDALGDPLLVRSGAAMVPTTRALRLVGPVSAALGQLRDAFGERAAFDPRSSTYRARIATTDYGEVVAVTRVMAALRRLAPAMSIQCRRVASIFEAPASALERGDLELALGNFTTRGRGLRWLPVFSDRWVVVGSRRKTGIAAFARAPQIQVMFGADTAGLVGDALRELGRSRFVPVVTPQFCTIPHYLANTDMLGVLPERLARALRLRISRLPLQLPPIVVGLVWHERLDADPSHRWLRERFTAAFATR